MESIEANGAVFSQNYDFFTYATGRTVGVIPLLKEHELLSPNVILTDCFRELRREGR